MHAVEDEVSIGEYGSYAGPTFFTDYDRFYRRQQNRSHWEPSGDRSETTEPLKVAYLFAEKRTGHPAGSWRTRCCALPARHLDERGCLRADLVRLPLDAFWRPVGVALMARRHVLAHRRVLPVR